MAEHYNIIPQVGRDDSSATSVPESHPGFQPGCPSDSGGGKSTPQLTRAAKQLLEKEKEKEKEIAKELTSGEVDREGNFKKKKSTLRTPPEGHRRQVLGSETRESDDEVFHPMNQSTQSTNKRAILKTLGINADAGAPGLEIIPIGTPDTQTHLINEEEGKKRRRVDNTPPESDLGRPRKKKQGDTNNDDHAQRLCKIKEELDNMGEAIQKAGPQKEELQSILLRIQKQIGELAETKYTNCKCTQTGKETPEITKTQIEQIKNHEEFKQKVDWSWKNDLFKNVGIVIGNPTRTTDDAALVVAEPQDPEMLLSIQRIFADKHPDLLEIKGELGILENTTKMVSEGKVVTKSKRLIKVTPDNLEEGIWEAYQQVKRAATEYGLKTLTTHRLKGESVEVTRKMLQSIFQDTDIAITLYKPHDAQPTMAEIVGGGKKRQEARERKQKTYETEAIEISEKGKEYKEVLKELQTTLLDKDQRKGVKTIRSTKNGALLIVLEKDNQKEKLLTAIQENLPECRIVNRGKNSEEKRGVFFVRDMDEIATREEVQLTLRKMLGDSNNTVVVGDLRPSRNNTQTATVRAPLSKIKTALEIGQIQVGLSSGRIEERHQIQRCFRCWSYDHIAKDCNEKDRRADCFKCGREGHKAADCSEEVRCPLCNRSGHEAGGKGCQAKHKAIKTARIRSTRDSASTVSQAENTNNPQNGQ